MMASYRLLAGKLAIMLLPTPTPLVYPFLVIPALIAILFAKYIRCCLLLFAVMKL
jgi:hypothetical protein